ncbi:helicase associated domain-containing protein [Streptomyces galilaeus]|uniref:helicase associated domain-containing protein n=1 Tax=Streptomyces galilaeus TaxID=33899 RepID=UPI0038F6DC2A
MENITTAAESTASGAAIEQLLFTTDWLTGGRATANIALTEQADYAYRLAYLSGGDELHPDAHSAAVANLLHSVAPGIVAFALHRLRPLLPDLSDEQWARVDAAAVELDLRLCEDLSGASVMPEAAGSPQAHAPHTPGVGRGMEITVDGEAEPVTVKLGVWLSNTKSRRDKLTAEQRAALRELGMEWA